jgi:ATP-binding protein involved in chromosome partitioning
MSDLETIFVYSGKGGVGKTTVSTNLAFANQLNGNDTGLFDADLQGPNVGSLVRDLEENAPHISDGDAVIPGTYSGVNANSMELLLGGDDGVYLSGQYLSGAIQQLLVMPDWRVDQLFIDLPPGTGKVHRNILSQLDGKAVLVTTPHASSLDNLRKGIEMLENFNTDIIGVIENMAYHTCSCCGEKESIFPGSAATKLCEEYDFHQLSKLPINSKIGKIASEGRPFVYEHPNSEAGIRFREIAKEIVDRYGDALTARPTSG